MKASEQAVEMVRVAARAAEAKHATNMVAFDVSGRLPFADAFLIVSGANERQVGGIVDGVEEALFKAGHKVKRREGEGEARCTAGLRRSGCARSTPSPGSTTRSNGCGATAR